MNIVKQLLLCPRYFFIWLVKIYQVTLRPFMGGHCRFEPTCSTYSIEVFKKYGAIRGLYKTAWRILRCNPLGGSGYDPP